MRTHLLQTTYLPAAAEADTGSAANDGDYQPCAAERRRPRRVAAADPAAMARMQNEDDYVLGGYAGI